MESEWPVRRQLVEVDLIRSTRFVTRGYMVHRRLPGRPLGAVPSPEQSSEATLPWNVLRMAGLL